MLVPSGGIFVDAQESLCIYFGLCQNALDVAGYVVVRLPGDLRHLQRGHGVDGFGSRAAFRDGSLNTP